MEFVGILKEHEGGLIKNGRSLSTYPISDVKDFEDIDNIINYLENGTILVAFLHWVNDAHNNPIAPMTIYTDGKWLWPSYLVYYLRQHYYSLLPNEFIDDIKNNKFIAPVLTRFEIGEVEKFHVSIYDPNRRNKAGRK
jgi:hypothetical protein